MSSLIHLNRLIICLLASLLVGSGLFADKVVYPVVVPQDVIDDYHRFMGSRGPAEVKRYDGSRARRDVIELVLIQQAIARIDADIELKLEPLRSYRAILDDLADGRYMMAGTSVWLADIEADVVAFYITEPVIREGQFEAGFYTHVRNRKALAAKSLEELQQLKAVTNRDWRPDWKTLHALQISEVRDLRSLESIVRLLATGRADFTLASFNTSKGMRIEMDGCVLVPIPHLKTALSGERVFAVSRSHPEAGAFFEILQAGLAELTAAGTVERAYRECGFINPQVKDWPLLRPVVD